MIKDLQLHADEVLLGVERYPGSPAYRVVTQQRTFDVPSLTELRPIIEAVAKRPAASAQPIRQDTVPKTP